MRMFLYYTAHSFKNQLKKMFKSWVLILVLACALFGALIGFGAGKIAEMAEETETSENVEEFELTPEEFAEHYGEDALSGEDEAFEDEAWEEEVTDESVAEVAGRVVDLIVTALILLLLILQIFGAEKAANRIFLPADAQLLFASPLKPQSVLLFRLMMQIALSLFGGIYLFIRLPSMMLEFGFGWQAAVAIIVVYILLIVLGRFLQVLIYTLASTHPGLQQKVRIGIYAFCGLLLAAFAYLYFRHEKDWFEALCALFTPRWTRYIPFVGWLKGIALFASEENWPGLLLCLLLLLLGTAGLVFIIWHVKADFYEDAEARSEETAELMEAARQSKGIVYRGKKKDRSERLVRDGLQKGQGANIFFYKAMYNRYRFAHFHFLTKTCETYLAMTVVMVIFLRFILKTQIFLPVVAVLAVAVFYRSIGNPLNEDTKKDFFLMIPESCAKKLFFSLLGGTANTAIDLLPAMLLAMIVLQVAPWLMAAWFLFILSVDFYSTVVASFIAATTPPDAGKTLKQVVQILFLYFGLLPDIAIIAAGTVMHAQTLALLLGTVFNCGIAAIFFFLTPIFLDPAPKAVR